MLTHSSKNYLSFSDIKSSSKDEKMIIKKQILRRNNTRKFIVTRFSVSDRNEKCEVKENQIILLSDNIFTLYKHLKQNMDFEEVNKNIIKNKESNNEIENIYNILISYSKFKNFVENNSIPESSIKKAINENNGTKLIKCKENALINSIYYAKFYIVIKGKVNYCKKIIVNDLYQNFQNKYYYPGDTFINLPSIPSSYKIDIISETNSVLLGFSKYSFEYYIKPFLIKEDHLKKEKILKVFPSLVKVSQNKFLIIYKNCIQECYKKSDFIYKEGEKAENLIFILKGNVGLTDKLNDKFLIEITEGCLCGFESIKENTLYKNNLVAKNDCVVLKIRMKVLKENCTGEIFNEIKNKISKMKEIQKYITSKNNKINSSIKKKFKIVYKCKSNSDKKENTIEVKDFLSKSIPKLKTTMKKFSLNDNFITPNIKNKKKTFITSRNICDISKRIDFSNSNNNISLMSSITPTKNSSNITINSYFNKKNISNSQGRSLDVLKRKINKRFNTDNFDSGNFVIPLLSTFNDNKK